MIPVTLKVNFQIYIVTELSNFSEDQKIISEIQSQAVMQNSVC